MSIDTLPVFARAYDHSVPTLQHNIQQIFLILQQYDINEEQFNTLALQDLLLACVQGLETADQLEFFTDIFTMAVQFNSDDLIQDIFAFGRTFYKMYREIADATAIVEEKNSYSDFIAATTNSEQAYLLPFYTIFNLYDHISTYLHLIAHAYLPNTNREYYEMQTTGLIMKNMYDSIYAEEDKFIAHIELMKQGANLLPELLYYVENDIRTLQIICDYFTQLQREANSLILNDLDTATLTRMLEFLYPRVGTLEEIDKIFQDIADVVLTVLNEQILNFRLKHESLEEIKLKEPEKAQFYSIEQLDNLYFYYYSATVNLYEKYKFQRRTEITVNFQPNEVVGSIYTLTELAFSIREHLVSTDDRVVFYENLLDLLSMEILDQIRFMRYRELILDHLIISGRDLNMQLAIKLKNIATKLNPFEGTEEFLQKYQIILTYIN